jgi:hypothetical protein
MVTCLFVGTSNDYVWTFKKSSLYYAFLQGGASRIGPDKNELRLHNVNQFGDLVQIVTIVAKYTSSCGLFIIILHLEDENLFGLAKRKANLPPRSKTNSHTHDQMNFSHLKMANAMTPINQCQLFMWEKPMMLIMLSPTMVWRSLNTFVGMAFGE